MRGHGVDAPPGEQLVALVEVVFERDLARMGNRILAWRGSRLYRPGVA